MKTAPYYVCLAAMILTARQLGYTETACEAIADDIIKKNKKPHVSFALHLENEASNAKAWVIRNSLGMKADKIACEYIQQWQQQ